MRRGTKISIVLILLCATVQIKAQSTATAFATVTIVTPVTISSDQSQGFETVAIKTPAVNDILFRDENSLIPKQFIKIPVNNSTVKAADFTINAGISDVYTLTVPKKILLVSASGIERMTADLLPAGLQEESIHYGKQHISINAALNVENGQEPGRYASQAFDVTVNFN